MRLKFFQPPSYRHSAHGTHGGGATGSVVMDDADTRPFDAALIASQPLRHALARAASARGPAPDAARRAARWQPALSGPVSTGRATLRETCVLRRHGELGDDRGAAELVAHLREVVDTVRALEARGIDPGLRTLVALFEGPGAASPGDLAAALRLHLYAMQAHAGWRDHWDPCDGEPAAGEQFAFALCGQRYYVGLLHAGAPDEADQLPRIALVFTLREGQDRLCASDLASNRTLARLRAGRMAWLRAQCGPDGRPPGEGPAERRAFDDGRYGA